MGDREKPCPSYKTEKEEKDSIIFETEEFMKFTNGKDNLENIEIVKQKHKRKRSNEESYLLENIIDIFLRIIYPLSRCLKKYVIVGIDRIKECKPVVIITQSGKNIKISETAWISLDKRMQLIDCYFNNKIFGKKTSFTLIDSDIEIDNIILRGEQYVRIRDVTKHDVKVQLTYEEFSMLHSSSAAINNYINQLHIVESCCKDYLTNTIDSLPNAQILYSPLDTSIMNRLPQEVELYKRMIIANRAVEESRKLQQEFEENNYETDESAIDINSQETDI